MRLLYEQFLDIKSFCREKPWTAPCSNAALNSLSCSHYNYSPKTAKSEWEFIQIFVWLWMMVCSGRLGKVFNRKKVFFNRSTLFSGAGACSCVSPHAQPDAPGHAADGGGADPDRAAYRPHPAPSQRRLRPRQRRLREEDPRVSAGDWRDVALVVLGASLANLTLSCWVCLIFRDCSLM